MSSKLYGRVSNFEDLEPLTADYDPDEPFQDSRISFARPRKFSVSKKVLLVSLLVFLALVCVALTLGVVIPLTVAHTQSQGSGEPDRNRCALDSVERFDCLPGLDKINESVCVLFECCWDSNRTDSPPCFYSTQSGYSVESVQLTSLGQSVRLTRQASRSGSPYGADLPHLVTEFSYETDTRLHIKVGLLVELVHTSIICGASPGSRRAPAGMHGLVNLDPFTCGYFS